VDAEQIARGDFPREGEGYDRASVDAHLAAVAAHVGALEARIAALGVERDRLRESLMGEDTGGPPSPTAQPIDPAAPAESAEPAEPVEPAEPAVDPASADDPASAVDPASADARPAGEAEVSARLVATRLALEGTGRDEIVERVSGQWEVEDAGRLVDDVLARLG
jgi:hypothetical protein